MTASVLALLCLASASVVAARPLVERRRAAVFGSRRSVPRIPRALSVPVVAVAGLVFVSAFGLGASVAAVAVAGTSAYRWRRSRRERNSAIERARLLDALEAIVGELRIGAHPSAAAHVAAAEVEGVAAQAFAVAAARSRLGGTGADGLRRPGTVLSTELDRVAEAWRLAEHHGLALAELLSAARTDLSGRIRFRARTSAAMAGARATACVLACLPLLGIGLGQLMGATPLTVLFHSAAGTILLPLGAALVCTGLLWADAITGKAVA
ncbi:type II secretion system F family protein [Nocardia bovistercoris]|uniref:Type II secretion system F family protein n=1 Tax=Nocardia bovistercoris TaxID=2785916 RepID=A0A931IKL8_9NOCA|nr:type II secretion system F family protein [Nocardia bovistercoris]MBH0781360.1 type II secretion system F family protein [Nocardia bovistercoris]